jgi:hypothetical protein
VTRTGEALVVELRAWAATSDAHVAAAVGLLIDHDSWLRRPRFLATAVVSGKWNSHIRWSAARAAFDAGHYLPASSTELAVLDLAIDLGLDRFRMGHAHRALLLRAVATALGEPVPPDRSVSLGCPECGHGAVAERHG